LNRRPLVRDFAIYAPVTEQKLKRMSVHAQTPEWWAGKWAWVWPIVAASALVVVTILVYPLVNPGNLVFADFTIPGAVKVASPKLNGLLWGSAVIIFVTVSIAAIMALATTVITSTRGYPRRGRFLMWAAAPIALMVFIPASPFYIPKRYPTTALVVNYIEQALPLVGVMLLMMLVTAWLVIAAASTCIPDDDTPERLQAANRRSQAVLFAGAAVLVAGVIEIDALLQWAASEARIDIENAKALSAAATIPTGTFFSLYLASAYLPAALVLRHRSSVLAKATLPGKTPAEQIKWMQDNGLVTSVATQLGAMLALLGPILASAPLKAIASIAG
jgi:hypothetical protein